MALVSGEKLSKLRQNGEIWQCNGGACESGWAIVDKHPNTVAIAANANLYQLRTGSGRGIFEYNEKPCEEGPGCDAAWDQIDANPATVGIVANGTLFSR